MGSPFLLQLLREMRMTRRTFKYRKVFEEIARLSKMSAEELEPILDNIADLRSQDVADHIESLIARIRCIYR